MKTRKSDAEAGGADESPSRLIDARIASLGDWRGETLARIRTLIRQADPEVVEEWKWRGVPVWSHAGIICTGETYKTVVKMTFLKGAALDDPSGLFNASLDGNTRRAIDLHEGDRIDETALKALIRAAVALNTSQAAARSRKEPKSARGASGAGTMARKFRIGDHVSWNSEAGRVSGTIIAIHTEDFLYKGHMRRASAADPQYEIKSDKTDHVAAHKGSALKRMPK